MDEESSLENLVSKEIESLEERDEVKAIAVVGSYARDPEMDHNDIDLYIIVDENWRKRVNKRIDGVLFEEFFNSVEWAKSYFER